MFRHFFANRSNAKQREIVRAATRRLDEKRTLLVIRETLPRLTRSLEILADEAQRALKRWEDEIEARHHEPL